MLIEGQQYQDELAMIKDALAGDESVWLRDQMAKLDPADLHILAETLLSNPHLATSSQVSLSQNLWRLNYVTPPPTPEQFLTEDFLGSNAENVFPHVRDTFLQFLDPDAGKRVLALSTCIGYGKSFCSVLIIMYLIVQYSYMRNPKGFLGLPDTASLVAVLMSFTLKKGKQLLLQPFVNFLRASPVFVRVSMEERLAKKQFEIGPARIAYTSAGRMGEFQFAKDIHIILMSDRAALLGLSVIAGVCSEISFWIKKGIAIDDIWGTFTDLRGRIESRFHGRYLTATILDSSPLDLNLSPIDKWIYGGQAAADKEVMVVNAPSWEAVNPKIEHPYPIWKANGTTFPVFRGDAARPAKILSEEERPLFMPGEIIEVPIDLQKLFEDNLQKAVCDICAYPSGGDSKLFRSKQDIEDIFTPQLPNLYTYIHAPATMQPDNLIWDQVKDKFFIRVGDRYRFHRYPQVPRFLHVDFSEVQDTTGIAMTHMEVNRNGEQVVVVDFTIGIMATKDRINLDAVSEFVFDLCRKGGINLKWVSADRYQSAPIIQRLKRYGDSRETFEAKHLSVDTSLVPYHVVVSWILTKRLKCGRNLLFKNNLGSLIETTTVGGKRKKIDHVHIKEVIKTSLEDWELSQLGWGAKDISDAVAGAAFACIEHYASSMPAAVWEDDNMAALRQDMSQELSTIGYAENMSAGVANLLETLYTSRGIEVKGVEAGRGD